MKIPVVSIIFILIPKTTTLFVKYLFLFFTPNYAVVNCIYLIRDTNALHLADPTNGATAMHHYLHTYYLHHVTVAVLANGQGGQLSIPKFLVPLIRKGGGNEEYYYENVVLEPRLPSARLTRRVYNIIY